MWGADSRLAVAIKVSENSEVETLCSRLGESSVGTAG